MDCHDEEGDKKSGEQGSESSDVPENATPETTEAADDSGDGEKEAWNKFFRGDENAARFYENLKKPGDKKPPDE